MDTVDLYALPPEDFTAARDAAAKQARADGDRARAADLAALRRPTAAAHAVNALVRAHPDLLERLLALGPALAQAQQAGRGAELTALGVERRALVAQVADRAGEAAGRALGAAAREEVVSTLEAAVADPASAEAVRTGRLVRALSFAGFGGVDLQGAVAEPGPSARTAPAPGPQRPTPSGARAAPRAAASEARAAREVATAGRREVAAAERRSLQVQGALDDAVRAHDRARGRAEQAAEGLDAATEQVARARQALQAAEQARRQAGNARREAAGALTAAAAAVRRAQREAQAAREELDRLRRG